MDALRLFCGLFLTTWLVWTLTTLFSDIDLATVWTPTNLPPSIDLCTKIWTVALPVKLIFLCFVNMNAQKCSVLSCNKTRADNTILHIFPNPEKEPDRFNKWIRAIGGNVLVLEPHSVFKNGRVCHTHFEMKYHTSSGRLSRNAIPSLHLSGNLSHSRRPMPDVTNFTREATYVGQGAAESEIQLVAASPHQPTPSTSTQSIPPTSMGESKRLGISFDHDAIILKNKIKRLQAQKDSAMVRLKKAMKLSENIAFKKALGKFSSPATTFTMLQFREAGKHRRGCRFTKDEKILSLALYKQGPRAYRWLKKFFVLPSALTLSRMITRASLHPGINDNLYKQLQKKVTKMTESEKLCIVLFDEIALTPHFDYNRRTDCVSGFVDNGTNTENKIADHALVFMVRGVQKNYKQPIAYTFCSSTTPANELASQLKMIIRKLKFIGLTVIATVCDQGATNVSAINTLINGTREKYLKNGKDLKHKIFEVDGDEVIPLYDPPHLIKGIRNNLLNKNLKYIMDGEEKTAKWSHILELYQQNPAYRGIRLMPKLTDKHVVPNKIAKMKVKCATQVFSRSVAANMGYLSKMGILPEECEQTADLLLFFDELFDSVNGSRNNYTKRSGKPLLGPVTPNSVHKEVWAKAKKILSTMKYVSDKKCGVVPSIANWLQTVQNIEYMVDVLSKRHNLTSVWLRHFNQDPLENFFGCIRSHSYRNTSPTCAGFEAAFASLLINNLSSSHSPGSNCEKDNCSNFKSLKELFFKKPEMSSYDIEIDFDDVSNDNVFVNLETKIQNPKIKAQLEYVTGYVLRKLQIKCNKCKKTFYTENTGNSAITYKEYFQNKSSLTYPSNALLKCFSNLQDIVTSIIKKDCKKKNIRQYIKTIFSVLIDYGFINCPEHKIEVIKKIEDITINIFIYNWCKDTNKLLNGTRTDFDEEDQIQVLSYKYCKKRSK